MLKNVFRRFQGVAIIHLYDKNGKKIGEFAKIEWQYLFSWPLFIAGMTFGLIIVGHI